MPSGLGKLVLYWDSWTWLMIEAWGRGVGGGYGGYKNAGSQALSQSY